MYQVAYYEIAFYSSVEEGRYISDFKEVEYTIT